MSRLLGDVRPAAQTGGEIAKIIRKNVADEAVLANFLDQGPVMYPTDYLQRSCHTPRHWLPVFYYMKMAGLTTDQAIALLEAEEPSYPNSCRQAIDRLKGKKSAFQKPGITPASMVGAIEAGSHPNVKDLKDAIIAARAIGGLTKPPQSNSNCLELLKHCLALTRGPSSSGARSLVYRAACWIDELIFRPNEDEKVSPN